MSAPVLSRPALAREAIAEAKETDLGDHMALIRSQARLTVMVEMLLHLLEEDAA